MINNTFKFIKNIFKKYFWVFIVVVVFIGMRWFYTRDGIKTVPVKVLTPESRLIKKTVSASGKVNSQSEADLSFGATGKITYLNAKKGQNIKKGTLLAQIDTQSTAQNVQYYKDTRDLALRDRELFIEQYESDKDDIGGEDEYDINLRKYDESLSRAEAAYQAQKGDLTKSYIYAPFDGVVIEVEKELSENATVNETIIKVANLDNIIFEIELDQEDYGLIKLNQPVEVELDAYEDVIFDGQVSLLPLYANGTNGSGFVVEISINPKEDYKPLMGMTGDVKIVVATSEGEVPSLVYDQIIYDDEDKPYVYVVNTTNSLIERRYVETGIEGDIYTELKSIPEESIVIEINSEVEIKEGYKAKVIPQ